jgi:cell division protein FtsI/penicillin-binding protein 2
MASSPNFDPNLFTAENLNSAEQLDEMLNDGQQRLLNRVTQGSYARLHFQDHRYGRRA